MKKCKTVAKGWALVRTRWFAKIIKFIAVNRLLDHAETTLKGEGEKAVKAIQLWYADGYFADHEYLNEKQFQDFLGFLMLYVGGADYDDVLGYLRRYAEVQDYATMAARFKNDLAAHIAGSADFALSVALTPHLPYLFVSTGIVFAEAFDDPATADRLRTGLTKLTSRSSAS